MDIKSRRILSKAIAALVFSAAVTGSVATSMAGAYDGGAAGNNTDGYEEKTDLGTSVQSILGAAGSYNVFLLSLIHI